MQQNIFEDNLDDYKSLIKDKTVKKHLPLYKDLIQLVANIQTRLTKSFYRVSDIEDLQQKVNSGRFKPAKYCIIEEDSAGDYRQVRYSEFFENDFKKIIATLQKINKDLPKGEYKDYIESLILAYQNNNFIDPFKRWLQIPNDAYPVEFMLFPSEAEFDVRFNTMLSFDASLRVLSPDFMSTGEGQFKDYLMGFVNNLPEFSQLHSQINSNAKNLSLRVDYSIYSAGVHHLVPYLSQNLPDEKDYAYDWGSKIVVYKTAIDKRAGKLLKESKNIVENFNVSSENFMNSLTYSIFSHEVVEALMKFEGTYDRLKSEYPKVREFNSEMFGYNSYVLYLLKHQASNEKIASLAYTYVLRSFEYFKRNVNNPLKSSHYYQYVGAVNYFLQQGAIEISKNNKVIVKPKEVLKCISQLANVSSTLLMEGSEQQAKDFIKDYVKTDVFKRVLQIG